MALIPLYVIFAITPWSHLSPLLRRRWEELLLWHKEQGITAIAIDLSQAKAWERALLLLNECLRQYGEEGWSVVSPHTSEVNVSRRRLFHVQRADVQMTQIQPGLRRLHYLWPQISDARPMMDPQSVSFAVHAGGPASNRSFRLTKAIYK
ncbi:polyferredoxin [Escherichia coli]|nr:polyferredoxin [Escherichia coli]